MTLDCQLCGSCIVSAQFLQPRQAAALVLLRRYLQLRQVELLVDQVPDECEQHRWRVWPWCYCWLSQLE